VDQTDCAHVHLQDFGFCFVCVFWVGYDCGSSLLEEGYIDAGLGFALLDYDFDCALGYADCERD